MESKIYLT